MATKKPTAKQLAARKLFAQRAKAGTLGAGKKRKKNPTLKPAAVKAKMTPPARKTNPRLLHAKGEKYRYHIIVGNTTLAYAKTADHAKRVGQALADATGKQVAIKDTEG